MSKRVHFVMPDELIARIDEALSEGQSRGDFVRRAVELRLHMRNLTNDEIDRLLADWRAASALRQIDGTYDDIDRGIALKAPAPKQTKKGAHRGS